jgi:hypothetical protein
MSTTYVPIMLCEKMAVTDMSFHQRAVIELLVKDGTEGNFTLHHHVQTIFGVRPVPCPMLMLGVIPQVPPKSSWRGA